IRHLAHFVPFACFLDVLMPLKIGLPGRRKDRIAPPTTRYNLVMLQIIRNGPAADVVVIGSGAGGGTVTKVLADLGVSVTLLEAGPMLNPAKDFKEHMWPYQVNHRGVGEAAEGYFGRSRWGFGYFLATVGCWQVEG